MNLYDIAWPNYELNLSQYVASFREGNDFSDITLLSDDDQHFSAHKFVLSACSPFFKNILKKYPNQFPVLYLGGVDSRNLEKLLDFMYKGSVKVPHEDLERVQSPVLASVVRSTSSYFFSFLFLQSFSFESADLRLWRPTIFVITNRLALH